MNFKQKHKDFLKENNLNSVTDIAWFVEKVKKDGGNRQMMFDLAYLLINEKDCLEFYFAAENKEQEEWDKLYKGIKQFYKEKPFSYLVDEAPKVVTLKESPLTLNDTFPRPLNEIVTYMWRPKDNQEVGKLSVEKVHVHPNIFNKGDYCAKRERVKDIDKEKMTRPLAPEECFKTQEEKDIEHFVKFADYNPLAPKQERDITTDDLAGFKTQEEKDIDSFVKTVPAPLPWRKSDVGVKETEGKLDYSEINFEILDLMAKRFAENKHKYPKGNSKKPLDKQEILWASFRHIRKMLQPIENDPETYEEHLAAVATNMSIILDQLRLNKS